jgi:hypothetical protein
MAIHACPKCGSQLEIKLSFASGPKSAQQQPQRSFGDKESVDTSRLRELLEAIDDDSLKGEAQGFVQQTRERFKQYGDRIMLSAKQMAWLEKLAGNKDTGESW